MGHYYHKSTGARIEAMQHYGAFNNPGFDLFVSGLRRMGDFGLVAPSDWIIKIDNESYCKCSSKVFSENYSPLPNGVEHSLIPQPKQWPLYKDRLSGISIEAVQWNGKDLGEIKAFAGEDEIRWDRISLQYYLYSIDADNDIYWRALSSGDYIYRLHKDNPQNIAPLSIMSEWLFTSIFTPITNKEEEAPMPAQPQTQDPFEPMRQVIDLDSYEYLNETCPFYIQAIEHALTAGKAPAEIGRFVVENTSSRRDIGLLCEQAARHIQRRRQAA